MNRAVLLLGSNLGNASENLEKAIRLILERIGSLEEISSVYETKPWGFKHENNFLNQVLVIKTKENPLNLLRLILEIEKELGRVRAGDVYKARTLDIDILYYNDVVLDHAHLKIPHPLLHIRKFTMVPLVEVLPDYIHPVLNKTNKELLEDCKDDSEVKLLKKAAIDSMKKK